MCMYVINREEPVSCEESVVGEILTLVSRGRLITISVAVRRRMSSDKVKILYVYHPRGVVRPMCLCYGACMARDELASDSGLSHNYFRCGAPQAPHQVKIRELWQGPLHVHPCGQLCDCVA